MQRILAGFVLSQAVVRSKLRNTSWGQGGNGQLVHLPGGLAFLANDDFLRDILGIDASHPAATGFIKLALPMITWARTWSMHGPLAYIESDIFGGVGQQAAVVWHKGTEVNGPLSSSVVYEDGKYRCLGTQGGAANVALRSLGISSSSTLDEYESLGLSDCSHARVSQLADIRSLSNRGVQTTLAQDHGR